jgi:hypothetical protein
MQRGGKLDAAAFLEHLATTVDPIVRGVANVFAERAEATAIALYDLSLELFAEGLLGPEARPPWVQEAWRRLLPALPTLMAREPLRLTACITNAVVNIAATPGARPQGWIDGLLSVGPHCHDLPALVECGKILAWRAGMAQYRTGALAAAEGLAPRLAGLALGLGGELSAEQLRHVIERLEADPWQLPKAAVAPPSKSVAIRQVARAGAFCGFGGPFLRPPVVSSGGGRLIASDGEGSWRILADAFGVVLLRDDNVAANSERPPIKIDKAGKVLWNGEVASFPDLREPVSWAGNDHTLAVTIATSHHVFLLAKAALDP